MFKGQIGKTVKRYPTISRQINREKNIFAFDKLDGSNIRAEWWRKKGFCKFGSRRELISSAHWLGESMDLVRSKYEESLDKVFRKERYERALCFFEFYGPHSFAGNHEREEHDIILLDVNPHRKGMLEARDFLNLFGHLDIPKLLYTGKANKEFEETVRTSGLSHMTFEGVVCKGKRSRKEGLPVMFKIKSNAWLEKLRNFCGGDEELFHNLQ